MEATSEPTALSPALDRIIAEMREKPLITAGDGASEVERRRRESIVAGLLREVGVRYSGATLDSFRVTEAVQGAVVDALRAFSTEGSGIRDGGGVLLYGPRGTGKDHLAIGALRIAILMHGWDVAWIDGQQLFGSMRDRISTESTEMDFIRQYTAPKLLLVSDPLPQDSTKAISDYQQSVLWRIVDRRYRDLKSTWVTLNVADVNEASKRLGPQLADRLTDGALCLHCNWPTYRKPSKVVK